LARERRKSVEVDMPTDSGYYFLTAGVAKAMPRRMGAVALPDQWMC